MIPTCIGLPATRKGQVVYDQIQDWMQAHGLSPYMPQLRHSASFNLGMAYNPVTRGLDAGSGYGWTDAMIAEVQRFRSRQVFVYTRYYYLTRPNTLRWRGADGIERTVDACSTAQLTDYLADSLQWLRARGLTEPEPHIFVDEPPHKADDGMGGGKYGWTPAVEAMVIKFVTCAQAAGWKVHVAVPGPSQLAFWRGKGTFPTADGKPRLTPDVWVLHDKNIDAYPKDVLSSGSAIWLYNSHVIDGLTKRMRQMGATGWHTWSGVTSTAGDPTATLFGVSGSTFIVRPEAWQLLSELAAVEKPATVEDRLADLERRVSVLELGTR